MNFRTRYATLSKKWPRFFDISKRAFRKFENADSFHRFLSDFERQRESIEFLQIGSNDGISNDPLREFIVRGKRWKGCLVEPLPHTFELLAKNYRYAKRDSLKLRNAAVSNHSGKLEIYRVKNEFHHEMPGYPDQVASFDPAHVLKHFPTHLRSMEKIESISVEVLTPSALIEEIGFSRIDILHLDVEGHEKKIFDAFPFSDKCPEIILFEHVHLSKKDQLEIEERLKGLNFQLQVQGFDTIAVKA